MPEDGVEVIEPEFTPSGPVDRPVGVRRAARSSRRPLRLRRSGGRRAKRTRRRARGLPGTLGWTVLSAFVPGSGYLFAGRKALGALVLLIWISAAAMGVWYFTGDVSHALDLAFEVEMLRWIVAGMGVGLLVWAFIVFTSHRMIRPRHRTRVQTLVGYVAVITVLAVGGAPVVHAGRTLLAQAGFVETVLPENPVSPTIPEEVTEEDPWAGEERVNVLLLGGDGGDGRDGVRTDTVILASIDTASGKTTLFSLPRNLQYAQFPEDSPLHDVYPDGYQTGYGDIGYDLLNAIYKTVPEQHPGILGDSDNEGADAIKLAVEGSLGIPVNYYVLVNLEGFKTIVDAMGGITVNINEPVAINGNTDAGIPPTAWLEPGPDQHLDGFHALWYARGRYGSDDYQRMDRQRCAIDALIEAANPGNLLLRYIDLAKAGEEVVYTDIPRRLASAFVELMLRVKDAKVRSVVFKASDKFAPSSPDFDYMREVVQKAIDPPKKKSGQGREQAEEAENPIDVCAYQPSDENLEASQ